MAKINLRPWREERTAARQKAFVSSLIASALCAAALVLMMSYYYDVQMDRQNLRNGFLQNNISKLDKKIKEIKDLKHQRERLLERLNAIQQLQGNRPITVRNFDELVRVLPDGVYYNSLQRKEAGFGGAQSQDAMKIQGLALQNKDVSELMRRLDSSIWFGEANLSKVATLGQARSKGSAVDSSDLREFDLSVILAKPEDEDAK
ncbi:PilN domain-containing protein [Neptunomonas antarctica]|uniref:Type IV pilus assembly protein PilN n=1 Tax=Neptunomonas antarctica TaxID=619304 RepID=A0A1N7J2Y9_9GAMM|nr:PilN domain-containing protein [Neptunomonas antarctica]SIS43728.1 type IV pilus assembly protein PilN [Neptunomonas antarctica]